MTSGRSGGGGVHPKGLIWSGTARTERTAAGLRSGGAGLTRPICDGPGEAVTGDPADGGAVRSVDAGVGPGASWSAASHPASAKTGHTRPATTYRLRVSVLTLINT